MLVDSFAKAGIMAIPLQPDDDQPDILFLAVDDAAEAAKELASGLFTISDVEPKDKETAFFMRGPENAEQVEKLCSRFSVAAEWSEGRDSPLTLTGMTNDVKLAKTEYLQFLKERVTYESSSQLQGRFCLEYLERFCSKSIDRISAEFEFCRAEVMLTARPYPRIVTKVTEEGRQPLQAKITELLKQLHFKRGDIKKHGANKYMDSNDFQREKEKIETKSEVVISVEPEDEEDYEFYDAEMVSPMEVPTQPESILLSSRPSLTASSKTVSLFTGDICSHRADAIVNAANERLDHIGGLAAHIVRCAGHQVQEESDALVAKQPRRLLSTGQALKTGPGRLTATKCIIHTVAPSWPFGARAPAKFEKVNALLRQAVHSSLKLASDLNLRSIAFPAIGAGIFGCPSDVVAENMIRAADEFFSESSGSSLHQIDFVMRSVDKDNVSSFTKALSTRLEPAIEFPRSSISRPAPFMAAEKVPSRRNREPKPERVSKESESTTIPKPKRGNVSVSLRTGDITKEKVDAIINSAAQKLNLDSGLASKAISRAAGSKLQEECVTSVKINGQLKPNQIRVTAGYDLPASHVLHLLCPQSPKDLASVINKCLKKASELKLSSVAFPAIGTGGIGMADKEAADALFAGIEKFLSKDRKSSLQTVVVIVYDESKLPAFQSAFEKFSSNSRTADKKPRSRSPSPSPEPALPANEAVLSNGCHVKVEQGNVTTDTTDVAVATLGVVLNTVLDADTSAKSQWKEKRKGLASSGVTDLTVSKLKCRHVYVVGPSSYDASQNDAANSQKISSLVEQCLLMANTAKLSSISVPAIGTGGLKYSNALCAKAILHAAKAFAANVSSPSLKLIRISMFDNHRVKDFEKELQSQFPSASSPRAPGMWTKLVGSMKSSWASISSSFTPSVPFPSFKRKKKLREVIADDPDVVHLAIVGNSNRACNNAWERLQTAVDSHCTRREYDGKLPSNINEGELKKFTAEMGVALSVKVIDSKPRIYLDGLRDDVTETMIKLGKRVNEILEEEHRALEIETFAEKITWSWQVDDAAPFKAFSKEENWKIEKDYQENPASSCSVPISDEVYKLDFAATEKMTAKKGKKKVAVVRKFLEHAAVDVPSLWSCRKLGSELLRFLLPSDSEEYQRVTKAFNSTFANNSAKIQKVERVECPDLYHGYLNKKKTLEEKRKQEIESGKAVLKLELFHGTATDHHNIDQIITHGFNRSYAGKAAGTAFGQGVYFAKMSSLSHRYTKPDLNGDRTMFYCYVLMGLSVVGNPSMVEPPLTDPSASKVDRYDSTVNNLKNPTIFVSCYRDYMAFPAYVITYRLEAKYETDLVQMAQISQASAKQRKITRKEVTTGGAAVEYPPTWTSKTDDDRTTRVSLDSSSQEYKTISGKFTSTLMTYSASIQTIERIENPAKFQLFAHARELLAKKRASKIKSGEAFLELELFHGTSEDTVQHIIDQGFNRIYARAAVGKLYGAGVYFAKDSAVSYNYAQPNAQLHRRMFLCNVLIGLSTVGKQHLLEPLVIDSRVSVTDRYDTTVNNAMNPEIFVSCYRDNWAYPAYLITFV
eukprot:m.275493 g.275493  ORF g.275493 m.275493 type:complete len:1563 (+) comp40601_c0_seq2:2453-7141(+)